MFIVKTSPRAFLYALLPLLIVQGMLFCNGLAGSQASPPLFEMPTPDRALALLALRISLDAAALVAGHFIARDFGWGSRAVYAVFGGLASAAGYAVALRYGLVWVPPIPGTLITAGILPTLGGMVAGFVYSQLAGFEPRKRPQAAQADNASDASDAAAASPQPDAAPAPAAFEGPVQVRTSLGAMFMAAMVPALLVAALFFTLAPSDPAMAMAVPAQMFVMTAIVTTIPALIGIALAHGLARGLRRIRGFEYAGLGALFGLALGLALIPFAAWQAFPFTGAGVAFLTPPLMVCGAIMMAVYRRFAGIEPRSLPEPVLAREVEALVPEDHPSRRSHVVVLNG